MNADDRWSMEVFVAEIDGETDAEARLAKADNRNFSGRGKAKLNPADQDVGVIGEEIAIARALSDLSHKLLHSAAVGVESMAHERARLTGDREGAGPDPGRAAGSVRPHDAVSGYGGSGL